jgi:hypothetical protein
VLALALWPLDARDVRADARVRASAALAAADSTTPTTTQFYTRSAVQVPCRRRRGSVCHGWLYEPHNPLPTTFGRVAAAEQERQRRHEEGGDGDANANNATNTQHHLPGAGVVMAPPLGAWRRHELHRPADALARAGLTVLAIDYAATARSSAAASLSSSIWTPAPATHAGMARDWSEAAEWLLARLEKPLPRDRVAAAVERLEKESSSSSSSNNASNNNSRRRRPPVAARVALFAWDWSASPAARAAAAASAAAGDLPGHESIDRVGAVVLANPWPAKADGWALLRAAVRRRRQQAAATTSSHAAASVTLITASTRLALRGLRDAARSVVGLEPPLWSPLYEPAAGRGDEDDEPQFPPPLFDAWIGGGGGGAKEAPPALIRSSFAVLALPWWPSLMRDKYVPRVDVPLAFLAPHLGDGRRSAPPRRSASSSSSAADHHRSLAAGIGEYVSASKRGRYVNFEVVVNATRAGVLRALASEPTTTATAEPVTAMTTTNADPFDVAMRNQGLFLHAVFGSEHEFDVDEALLAEASQGGDGEGEDGEEEDQEARGAAVAAAGGPADDAAADPHGGSGEL